MESTLRIYQISLMPKKQIGFQLIVINLQRFKHNSTIFTLLYWKNSKERLRSRIREVNPALIKAQLFKLTA